MLIGAGGFLYLGWVGGSAAGALAGDTLTDPSTLGLDAAFPALFLALLAPLNPGSARAARGGARRRHCAGPDSGDARGAAGDRGHRRLPGGAHEAAEDARAAGDRAAARGALVSTIWLCVLVVGVATIAIKASGPVLAAERELPLGAARVVDLLAPALLAALVATQAFAGDDALVLDERAAGLLAAGVAILLRAPLLVVVLVAAATAAGLRAI